MKVPNFLLEHWTAREDGRPTEVGTVKETVGPDGKKSMSLQLSDEGDYPAEWPREYDFGLDAPPTSMHVFSSGAKGGPMQLDGRVEKRVATVPHVALTPLTPTRVQPPRPSSVAQGEVKPQGLSKQYRAITKSRVAASQVRQR